jgi:copper oxidase (laccase) domain-containing protein
MAQHPPVQTAIKRFPALDQFRYAVSGFVCRIPGIEPSTDRELMLGRLEARHAQARETLGMGGMRYATAGQTHGNGVAVVEDAGAGRFAGVDALITAVPGVALGIYVADCCAVYLLDPVRRCIGLAHSGKKGTELGVVPAAIEKMRTQFGCDPASMVAQLSPCIRPPDYEVDFAAEIARQCHEAGLKEVCDGGENTASDLGRYYSYRVERGNTGRMLALLAMI